MASFKRVLLLYRVKDGLKIGCTIIVIMPALTLVSYYLKPKLQTLALALRQHQHKIYYMYVGANLIRCS